jgi:hypothetical protein
MKNTEYLNHIKDINNRVFRSIFIHERFRISKLIIKYIKLIIILIIKNIKYII